MATTVYRASALPVYKRGLARSRPWPYHAVIDEVGVILGATSKNGAPGVQSEKPEDQAQVAPTDFGENATNPIFGRTQTWRTLHLGMGLQVEDADPTQSEGRYRWAINCDCSVASRIAMKGPQVTRITPTVRDATAGVAKFFDLDQKLYYLNGRYLMRVDDDGNCTMIQDFGEHMVAVDVAVFASNFFAAGTGIYAYIAVLDSSTAPGAPPVPDPPDQQGEYADTKMWRFDGTTAVQHATMTARNFCVIGRDFYRANGRNQVSTVDVDSDPWDEANWRAENQYLIGDRTASVVALICNAVGALVVLKQDGVYSVDQAGESVRYYPFLRFGRNAGNGVTWGVFMNDLYVRYGESLYRITPDFTIQEVGPNRAGSLSGPVKGRTTAFAGHGNFHAYTGMWDADTDSAFVMKYGAHQPNERGEPERIEAWHGSITYPVVANRITQMYVTGFRAPAAHNRMYVGFRDGTLGFFQLPCVPDPAACEEYRWSAEDSWVVMPNWHAGFPSSPKSLKYVSVGGDNLNPSHAAAVSYRLDPVSADASFGMPWINLAGSFDTTPAERIEFPDGTQCLVAAFRLSLHSIDPLASPLVTSLSLRWRLISDFVQVYSLIVLAEDGLVCRDGTPLRRGAKLIREWVRGIAATGRVVRLILPDEDVKMVAVVGYSEAIGWYERKERWASGIKIQVAEDATGGTYGTYKRLNGLKYKDLNGRQYKDLNNL